MNLVFKANLRLRTDKYLRFLIIFYLIFWVIKLTVRHYKKLANLDTKHVNCESWK